MFRTLHYQHFGHLDTSEETEVCALICKITVVLRRIRRLIAFYWALTLTLSHFRSLCAHVLFRFNTRDVSPPKPVIVFFAKLIEKVIKLKG